MFFDIEKPQFQLPFFIAERGIVQDGMLEKCFQQDEQRSFICVLRLFKNGVDECSSMELFRLAAVGASLNAVQGNVSEFVFLSMVHGGVGDCN